MDDFKAIRVDVDRRGLARVTLNNPARKNALNAQMMDELTRFAVEAPGRGDIKVVVVTGAEGTFLRRG